jgi:hypothetical protein
MFRGRVEGWTCSRNKPKTHGLTRKAASISKSKKKKNKKKSAANKADEADKVNGDNTAAQAEEHDDDGEDEDDHTVRHTTRFSLTRRLT